MNIGGRPLDFANDSEGRYTNYFKVGHNAFEFVVDFGQFYQENHTIRYHTRIITSPIYAKAFLETFQESIRQYEQTYGEIPE